ncbi:MAG: hypothetical protein ACI8ZM_000009 [Crocinitomix sp.]|jgi:hypothetical protein
MKSLRTFSWIILIAISTASCIKAESYCELPPNVIEAFEFASFGNTVVHAPSDDILIYTNKQVEEGTTSEEVLYSFSTPHYFINPKGDYPEDIVKGEEYLYQLKDTTIYADTIPIEIYSFNDCGRSIPFKAFIVFE